MRAKLKTLIAAFAYLPIHWLLKIIPKNKNVWVYGAWMGKSYGDNSKYFFEYANKLNKLNESNIKHVWITRSSATIDSLRKKGYLSFHPHSMKGLFYSSIAYYSIFTHSIQSDISWVANNGRTRRIQLWHGVPLKKIGKDDSIFTSKPKSRIIFDKIINKAFPFKCEKYDLMVACSEQDEKSFMSAFDVVNIQKIGYPRNDQLVGSGTRLKKRLNNVLYMPTFRGDVSGSFDLFDRYGFSVEEIDRRMDVAGCCLYIKTHPVNKANDNVASKIARSRNIKILDETLDAIDLLRDCDILITDYSSVYFDYLLTERPIIFAPFDIKEYVKKDRELYYDYDTVTPGPKCMNWYQILDCIENIIDDPEWYHEQRRIICDTFHENKLGNSSSMLYKILNDELH